MIPWTARPNEGTLHTWITAMSSTAVGIDCHIRVRTVITEGALNT